MYDIKNLPATPANARRLIEFAKLNGMVLADNILQLAQENKLPLLAKIPMEMPVQAGGDEGLPIVLNRADSISAKAFGMLASRVLDQVAKPPDDDS